MDDIFELAKAKALIGGGGKRTGTAIPVGQTVDRIYFNTNNTREETSALLSQLTYIEGLLEFPVALIYGHCDGNFDGDFIYAMKSGELYAIAYQPSLTGVSTLIFVGRDDVEVFENGWWRRFESYGTGKYIGSVGVQFMELQKKGQPMTDLQGVPIGAENDKIKNVLSITPF